MGPIALAAMDDEASDEELVSLLAAGRQEALGPLYSRYASLIYNLAAQSLDRGAAEDVVQEVLLTVWRKASLFDPERGPFRPWVLQIAHFRVLNELRRRSRRPQLEPDPEGLYLSSAPDPEPGVDEQAWNDYRRAAVRDALRALPAAQQQAVGLAFFGNLTHEEVASTLNLPLGTAKTRIRLGLQKLRANLAPLGVAVLLAGGVAVLGVRYATQLAVQREDDRALALLTDSTTQALRMTATAGVSAPTHAVYRGHAGASIAVINLEHFVPAPAGKTYQVWIRHGEDWSALGAVKPNASGEARLIVENPIVATPPDALQITVEPAGGSHTPTGPVVVAWPGP